MKKWIVLLFVLLMSALFFGCSSQEEQGQEQEPPQQEVPAPAPEGFNFLYNEAGEEIRLGMTRQEVEEIFGPIAAFVIYAEHGMLRVFFDEDGDSLYSIDTMFFHCAWILPGGIRTGSDISEMEQLFDMDYAEVMRLDDVQLITFRFTADHVLTSELFESAYQVEFMVDLETQEIDTISLRSRQW